MATIIGVALVWGGLGFFGYMVSWQARAHRAQMVLVRGEQAIIAANRRSSRSASGGHASHPCVVPSAQPGQLAGLLEIPALDLTAPVEEGTDDSVLAVAVGHAPTSVWPGSSGAAVLLAHDVSYFVHLGQLQPSDSIVFQNACDTVHFTVTGLHVVAAGSPIQNSTGASLVLDTCYPPDALFFTSQRLLVDAVETTQSTGSHPLATPGSAADDLTFRVPAAPTLVAQGLTLEQNEAPMGTMSLVGATSASWEQSPGPLALEAAALEAYFGGLHAAAARRADWWTSVAPDVAMPTELQGAQVTGHDSPLDVEIVSADGQAEEVVLRTTVTLNGAAPGTYQQTVVAQVSAGTVTIASWQLAPM